jgi:hypothetical protein
MLQGAIGNSEELEAAKLELSMAEGLMMPHLNTRC